MAFGSSLLVIGVEVYLSPGTGDKFKTTDGDFDTSLETLDVVRSRIIALMEATDL